jgi:hypothetical protein
MEEDDVEDLIGREDGDVGRVLMPRKVKVEDKVIDNRRVNTCFRARRPGSETFTSVDLITMSTFVYFQGLHCGIQWTREKQASQFIPPPSIAHQRVQGTSSIAARALPKDSVFHAKNDHVK